MGKMRCPEQGCSARPSGPVTGFTGPAELKMYGERLFVTKLNLHDFS